MRKNTDCEAVLDIFKAFVSLPFTVDEKLPFIVHHPIADSPYLAFPSENGEPVLKNIIEDETAAKECRQKAVETAGKIIRQNVPDVLEIICLPYRIAFLKYVKPYMSKKDFSTALRTVWITSENPNQDPNVNTRTLASWFRNADRQFLMTEEELEYLLSLPDSVKVYRGVSVGRNPGGLSWTDDIKTAKWFAKRFESDGKKGYVRTGIVKKEDVLCRFDSRGEKELVVDPKKIENLENIKF